MIVDKLKATNIGSAVFDLKHLGGNRVITKPIELLARKGVSGETTLALVHENTIHRKYYSLIPLSILNEAMNKLGYEIKPLDK